MEGSQEQNGETALTKEAVIRLIRSHKMHLQSLGIRRLALFGSFVRGGQRPDSDIDLLVEFERDKKTYDNFIEVAYFLEDLLRHRVELVTMESLSPFIGPHILRELEDVLPSAA